MTLLDVSNSLKKYFIIVISANGITTEVESSLEHNNFVSSLADEYKEKGYIIRSNKAGAYFIIKEFNALIIMTEKQYSDFMYEQQRQASLQRFNPNSRG